MHGFDTDVERRISRETEVLFRERLALIAVIGAVLMALFVLVDVLGLARDLPRGQLAAMVTARFAGSAVFGLGAWYLVRSKPTGLALRVTDLVLVATAALVITYVVAAAWDKAPDYWVALAQLVLVRCLVLPGGPRRAVPSCLAIVASLPAGLVAFNGFDAAVLTGESGTRAALNTAGVSSFLVLGLTGSYLYHRATAAAIRAHHQGRYQLHALLGRGGMGAVYKAWDSRLARYCALKVIEADTAGDVDEARRRFEAEARRTSQLADPNVIEIHDFGETTTGNLYYAMEYLQGASVEDLVAQRGPLPPALVIHLGRQACRGLAAAHQRGLVHRDVKPANLFVVPRTRDVEQLKVLDFGLVKLVAGANTIDTSCTPAEAGDEDGGLDLTRAGTVLGTPAYMAPEQLEGAATDERCDIYALGGSLFFALTGRQPFESRTLVELMFRKTTAEAPRPTGDAIPTDLQDVVARCLARDPAERFSTVDDVRRALDASPSGDAWTADRAGALWSSPAAPAASRDPSVGVETIPLVK